jgi:predicted metal-dependent phosphoesterase TrpH
MKIDLHCHSKYSLDNHIEPEELIRRALALKLDGVCFTEHYSVQASQPVDEIDRPDGFLILRGVEVSTELGHLLVYGVKDDSWNCWGRTNYLNLPEVVDRVHDLGGICVPAHPFRGWESLGKKIYSISGIDGIETHNGANSFRENSLAEEAAGKLSLPSTGGSDCHYLNQVGRAFTEFDNQIPTLEDLVREIKAGRCRGRMSYADFRL